MDTEDLLADIRLLVKKDQVDSCLEPHETERLAQFFEKLDEALCAGEPLPQDWAP